MSYNLTNLSLKQTDLTSSEQLILMILAHRANDENQECWPSIRSIVSDSKLDRKTVQSGLVSLEQKKLICKTGSMTGKTRRVPVYKLTLNDPKNGIASKTNDPVFPTNDPKNGIVKRSQKRDTEYKDLNDHKNALSFAQEIQIQNQNRKPKPGSEEYLTLIKRYANNNWVFYIPEEYREDVKKFKAVNQQ